MAKGNPGRGYTVWRTVGISADRETQEFIGMLLRDPCSYCGKTENRVGPRGRLQGMSIDHIVPHRRSGESGWENLTAACRSCNSRKNKRKFLELVAELGAEEAQRRRMIAACTRPHLPCPQCGFTGKPVHS